MALSEQQENALRGWVVVASGFAEDKVVWSYENGNRPSGNVITLALVGGRTLGACDTIETRTDLTRPAGQEIEHRVRGEREHVLRIQAFTPESVNGPEAARGILCDVQTKLRLPAITDALDEVGLSVFDPGAVQYIPGIANTAFEGRAVVEARFYATDTASGYTGYIASTEGDGALAGGFDTLPVEINVTS